MLIPDDVYTELRVGPRSVIRSGDKCRIRPKRAYGRTEQTPAEISDTPRIYVADLAAYNAGYLHGRWIDATQDADVIEADVRAMLAEIPDEAPTDWPTDREEWAIHDYDGFHGIKLSEWESFATVSELAQAVAEHGPAFAAFITDVGIECADEFEGAYLGEWESLEDYAAEFLDDCGALNGMEDGLRPYFDLSAYARDLRLGGDVWTADAEGGGVYVFSSY